MTRSNAADRPKMASPCISICAIHPVTRMCTGCKRSREEIALWTRYSDEERAAIMRALPDRTI
ncbi:DUF1289 domain-containing protein [Pseudoruegeria sp. SK021]|uniref:DUF1289 domain-containing protein n=1 Tax=Pseudoruegeria sp. SK021 TaxID=1933035 RepID=UPI000A218F7B|nr:DUF1289 domain-containing protein [Pseudoruegeria sp. SK021]OSP56148.1 hypothetical protein BV911_04245 [Pseudoruegeria sp. SK021]